MPAKYRVKSVWALSLLLLLLIICNFAFVHSDGWSRLGWQLFSFGGLLVVFKIAGLNLADIGLSRAKIGSGFKYAFISVGIIAVIFLVLFLINQNIFKDSRYNQSVFTALTTALLIIPLKTVIFEELAFRGIMPALLKDLGANFWVILISSSLIFGLWHILSAPSGNSIGVGHFSNILVLCGVLIATSTGGAILYLLRNQSGSLIAPIIVHWFVNGFAIVLAAFSWHK